MGPLALFSYGVTKTNEVVVGMIIVSLGFYVLYVKGEVDGYLENDNLKSPTQVEGSKHRGRDLTVIRDTLLTSEHL